MMLQMFLLCLSYGKAPQRWKIDLASTYSQQFLSLLEGGEGISQFSNAFSPNDNPVRRLSIPLNLCASTLQPQKPTEVQCSPEVQQQGTDHNQLWNYTLVFRWKWLLYYYCHYHTNTIKWGNSIELPDWKGGK